MKFLLANERIATLADRAHRKHHRKYALASLDGAAEYYTLEVMVQIDSLPSIVVFVPTAPGPQG
jgi:hypothetical protein